MVGQGEQFAHLRHAEAELARSIVLSPISARATTSAEVSIGSMECLRARLQDYNDTGFPARPGRKSGAIGLARTGTFEPLRHDLSAEYVDALSRGPDGEQDPRVVTLDDALELSGVAAEADTAITNPRLVGRNGKQLAEV